MSRLLVVVALLATCLTFGSALQCYTCDHHEHGAGPCETIPFNTSAPGVSVISCETSCEVQTSISPNGRAHIGRACTVEKQENKCGTRPSQHPPGREVSFCTCNEDLCNAAAPVPPTADPAANLTCYNCGFHEHGTGVCEKEPFDPLAIGVSQIKCNTSCEVRKTIRRDGQIHVSRTCATEKLKDGCDSRTVVRPGVFGHHNETWCGCNTDLCNIQSPPLPTADDAGPTIKCYACGGQNSSAACEAMPFDPTAEGVTTVDCTTSCDVGKTFSDDGKVHTMRGCSHWKGDDGCRGPMPVHFPGQQNHNMSWCRCNTDYCNTEFNATATATQAPSSGAAVSIGFSVVSSAVFAVIAVASSI